MNEIHFLEAEESEKMILLNTIKFPKNLQYVKKDLILPKSNYQPVKLKKQIERYLTSIDNMDLDADNNKSMSDAISISRLKTENTYNANNIIHNNNKK